MTTLKNGNGLAAPQVLCARPRLKTAAGGSLVLTPLIDALLLLLVFMFLSSATIKLPGISIDLPTTEQPVFSTSDKVVVSVDADGDIYFNDELVRDPEHLDAKLEDLLQRRGREPIIILRADRDLSYQTLVDIMSITRSRGARVYLVTEAEGP